jgi:hypothetical protein
MESSRRSRASTDKNLHHDFNHFVMNRSFVLTKSL